MRSVCPQRSLCGTTQTPLLLHPLRAGAGGTDGEDERARDGTGEQGKGWGTDLGQEPQLLRQDGPVEPRTHASGAGIRPHHGNALVQCLKGTLRRSGRACARGAWGLGGVDTRVRTREREGKLGQSDRVTG